jgi:DNA invertase Pin-like site-specific DNA recombinase
MGQMTSNGHRIFGYDYIKTSPTAPAALIINTEQAAVVRSIFEMFATGRFGLVTISRILEERGVRTRTVKHLWDNDRIKYILTNETYAGTRHFNRITRSRCSSNRRWQKVVRPSGKISVYHLAAYRCNRRARENNHDRSRIERCRNSAISTHILESKVFQIIQEHA